MFDFHTHRLSTPPGKGIVCLPRHIVMHPETFHAAPRGLYSAGVHPWWTEREEDILQLISGVERLLENERVVMVGECGLDTLRGANAEVQEKVFRTMAEMAEERGLPVTVHCVRAFDRLLHLHKCLHPSVAWTVHGFRGRPALAKQLLAAGMNLSFGKRHNAESLATTPPLRRRFETDDDDEP